MKKLTAEQKQQLKAEAMQEYLQEKAHWDSIAAQVKQVIEDHKQIREYATFTNLTAEEKAMLFEFSKRKLCAQHPDISGAATWALRFALCHPKQLLAWASWLIRYERSEGVNQIEFVNKKIGALVKTL